MIVQILHEKNSEFMSGSHSRQLKKVIFDFDLDFPGSGDHGPTSNNIYGI